MKTNLQKYLIKALRGTKPKFGINKNKLKKLIKIFTIQDTSFLKKMQISIEKIFMILKITDIILN